MSNMLTFKKLLLGCLLFWSVAHIQAQVSLNSSHQNFIWYTNNHFKLSKEKGSYKIEMDKMPWEAFTLFLNEANLSNLSVLKFKIKSDAKIDLRLDMIDYTGELNTMTPLVKTVNVKGSFVEMEYDFSNVLKTLDATRISHLLFYVEPGERHQGTIVIKDLFFQNLEEKDVEEQAENIVSIASNLNKKEITIQSRSKEFDQINIYNNLGQLVFSQKNVPTLFKKVNIEQLEQGIFFLEMKREGDIFYMGSISR